MRIRLDEAKTVIVTWLSLYSSQNKPHKNDKTELQNKSIKYTISSPNQPYPEETMTGFENFAKLLKVF